MTHGAFAAESLSGSKGHVRFPVYSAPGTVGGCGKSYSKYIAARGHSAYDAVQLGHGIHDLRRVT